MIGPLSWEHVPPEAAFNKHRVVRATQEQLLKPGLWDGQRGDIEQRGSGAYTLCERCNNLTGHWYGTEYASWAKQALECLSRIPLEDESPFFVPFRGYPLRFIKQVITLFFSVNSELFAQRHPELVKFVLDRRATGLPPEYKVDLVLVRGAFSRTSGVSGSINTLTGESVVSSEVAHYPFALTLILEEERMDRRGALEPFANCGFDEKREVWLHTRAGDIATKFPGDFRSRARVLRDAGG